MCRTSRKTEKEDVLSGMETDEESTPIPPIIAQPVVKTSTIGTGMKLKRNVEVCQEMVVDYYHYYLDCSFVQEAAQDGASIKEVAISKVGNRKTCRCTHTSIVRDKKR